MPLSDPARSLFRDASIRWNAESNPGTPAVVTYSAPIGPESAEGEAPGFTPFSAAHELHIQAAFALWGSVGGLSFVQVPWGTEADITVTLEDMTGRLNSEGRQSSGRGSGPSTRPVNSPISETGAEVYDNTGFIQLNRDFYAASAASIAPGQRGYSILIHEVGHGIGLKHPFEGPGEIIEPQYDHGGYTIMSYDRSRSTTQLGTLDVEVVRHFYGTEPLNAAWDAAAGAVRIGGGAAADRIIGTFSPDIIRGFQGPDTLAGRGENDTLEGAGGNDRLFGQLGDDRLIGGAGGDYLDGGSHNDHLSGGGRGDTLDGGQGNDTLLGGPGADTLHGSSNDDILIGNGGADRLFGDGDNDTLSGGGKGDRLFGGDGNDALSGNAGADRLDGGLGEDELSGGAGVDALRGGSGDDSLFGGPGKDQLRGEDGVDHLFGGPGADLLLGGDWGDTLNGGAGNDTLRGGPGADVFDFDPGFGVDHVYLDPFLSAISSDVLMLDRDIWGGGLSVRQVIRRFSGEVEGEDALVFSRREKIVLHGVDLEEIQRLDLVAQYFQIG